MENDEEEEEEEKAKSLFILNNKIKKAVNF
jgi:hypothetical protein